MSELLMSYNEGNKRAYDEIMKRCLDFVKRKIYANNIDCTYQKDELVMQVIVKVLTKMDTFIPDNQKTDMGFWAWVSTICYNNYMDYCRKLKRNNIFLCVDDRYENGDLKNEISVDDNWLKHTSNKDHLNKMIELAKQLPEKQYKIIKLTYWFDMNNTEIAKRLNETENNVRVLHHRALKRLYILMYGGNDNSNKYFLAA
jgi:RNA polymerase sigma factor (sigma-70 family)